MLHDVPAIRVRDANDAPIRSDGEYVLYWMIASRRLEWNFSLQLAAGYARELGRPLIILEAIRAGYGWASDRLHRFALDGMADNRRAAERAGVLYYPYVEPAHGEGSGLLEALSKWACVVVTDEFPSFFLPRMLRAAADRLDVRMQAVDSNGLLPLHAADKAFTAAYHFRRFLQRALPEHLDCSPEADPLAAGLPDGGSIPSGIIERWPAASAALLDGRPEALAALPIDHGVPPVSYRGGTKASGDVARRFLDDRLESYAEKRNDPDAEATSNLSPYLHWGHVSVHRVLAELAERENWDPSDVASTTSGARAGWWNMSAPAEAFLDELITWREVGYNACTFMNDYDTYASLPDWARETLADHSSDPRPHVYDREQFENAETHDPLWNAAQRQLRVEGRIHNYLRMLWGKKILEWSKSPQDAFALTIELNNRWGVDGRNPNSFAGITWVYGRYDRGWPERPIYGKVRSMSSDSTRRKVSVDAYLKRWGNEAQSELDL